MRNRNRQDTEQPAAIRGGTPIEPVPIEVAASAARAQRQRRRWLAAIVLAPAIAVALAIVATQVKLGGRSAAPAVHDWTLGLRLVEAGKTAKGIALLETLVEALPEGTERTRGHLRLAEVYVKLGEKKSHYFNSAIRHYARALEAPAEGVPLDELLYKTGRCFLRLGSYESALEFFQRLGAEFPESPFTPEARLEAAECLLAMGKYEAARRAFAEVAKVYWDDPLGETAFFRFADSFVVQAQSLRGK